MARRKEGRRGMRVSSPSTYQVFGLGTDSYMTLREYCTCPGCHTVWEHKETGDLKADWQWAKMRYQPAYTCGECGLTTEAIPKPTFWQDMRGEYRRLAEPRTPNPYESTRDSEEEER